MWLGRNPPTQKNKNKKNLQRGIFSMLNAIFGYFCVKASWSDRMFASLLTASLELSTSTQSAIERWTFESLLNLVWTLTLPIQLSMWFRGSQFRVVLASFTVAYTIKHKKYPDLNSLKLYTFNTWCLLIFLDDGCLVQMSSSKDWVQIYRGC